MTEPDKCEFCLGAKGGTPGNENRIGGKVVCDYCHALLIEMQAGEQDDLTDALARERAAVEAKEKE
jgi:hypothetical protein